MTDWPADPIGAAWLAQAFGIPAPGGLPVMSLVAGRRGSRLEHGIRVESYPEAMRPAAEAAAHLQFHLRHEGGSLQFLARLFQRAGPGFVQAWVRAEPTGQYARRAAFLYEWLTGEKLEVPARLAGNYVDAIDAGRVVASSPASVVKVQRWRVNDNLPGTPAFCPQVFRTEAVDGASALDVPTLFQALKAEFGDDLVLRSAVWLSLRESKASFAIEGEAERAGRVQRFADVMARHTGAAEVPLTGAALAALQRAILGDRSTLAHFGLRRSPFFVGATVRYQELLHYVAPPPEALAAMLDGLRVFLARTEGQSPVMRSAVTAFAFVYIHPLADGNGRVHRFLVNDILRRDGAIPEPVILPISALITDDPTERRHYDQVLDAVSGPLMQLLREHVSFSSKHTTYPDGVVSNFVCRGDELAWPMWRYPELGPHVVFLSRLIHRTLTEQMPEESRYLRKHAKARAALKEVVEMPDHQADRVLRSIEQNGGVLSNVLAREIPILARPGIWQELVEAVARARSEG